jgi:hypothetical protein
MSQWLRATDRVHVSQEVELDIIAAEEQTELFIESQYKKVRGVPERFWRRIEQHITETFNATLQPDPSPDLHLRLPLKFPLEDALKTAFYIARRFYDLGVQERTISHVEFGRFVKKNDAHQMQVFLTRGPTWLRWTQKHKPEVESKSFKLLKHLWPMRPREPSLYAP